MKVRITVYEGLRGYFAVRSFPNDKKFNSDIGSGVFYVEKDIIPDDINVLEEETRKKAKEHNIDYVKNLD